MNPPKPKPETDEPRLNAQETGPVWSLSRRLLALIVFSIMLIEAVIYFPSAGRYWQLYLEDVLEHGHIAAEAVSVLEEDGFLEADSLSAVQQEKILGHSGIHSVALRHWDGDVMEIKSAAAPPPVHDIDLRETGLPSAVIAAVSSMMQGENRVLRVTGAPHNAHSETIEVIIDETDLRAGLLSFSGRILLLSILASLFTAGFVFLSLRRMIILPLRRITERVARFRENPEAPPSGIPGGAEHPDEIGAAENELIRMHNEFRLALRQRTRLAAIGAAMGKINHSLRNTLTTAVMAADALSAQPDQDVKQTTQRLVNAVKRAVELCSSTMDFASDAEPRLNPAPVKLRAVVKEVFEVAREAGARPNKPEGPAAPAEFTAVNKVETALKFNADHTHLFRALFNLVENAVQAGAWRIEIDAILQKDHIEITVKDNGPGINPHLRNRLFEPLFDVNRKGGAGLGLVAVRDAARAHRGSVKVAETGPSGTVFSLTIPRTL